jgi:hypothetical protein
VQTRCGRFGIPWIAETSKERELAGFVFLSKDAASNEEKELSANLPRLRQTMAMWSVMRIDEDAN